jgi:hypothetical protein
LRSVGRLDVLSSTPAAPSGRAPCIHARLRRLATKSGEKSGLEQGSSKIATEAAMGAEKLISLRPLLFSR